MVMALNVWTNMILVRAAHRYKVYDLGGLLGSLPGRWTRIARASCDLSIWISVFLCLVGYLIVVADSLELLLPKLARSYRVMIGGFIALPLAFLDQNRLAFSSTLSILANIYVFALLLWSSSGESDELRGGGPRCLFGVGHGSITMISALMQAAIVQMCVLPMYEQLDRRSPERFTLCAVSGFGSVTVLFIVFSSLGYLLYGAGVSSNILRDLPKGLAGDVARIAMAIAVLGVYPIILSSMIAPIQHAEQRALRHDRVLMIPSPKRGPGSPGASPSNSPPSSPLPSRASSPPESPESSGSTGIFDRTVAITRSFRWSHVATLLVVIGSMVGAVMTHSLGFVNIVNGALQVAALVALAPSAVGYFLLGRTSLLWRGAMITLLCSGLLVSALGFVYVNNDSAELVQHCIWSTTW
jgi:amino acid permease